MNYLPLMTDEDIKYICSVIHPQMAISYFKHHSKDFTKVFPGFRPNTIARHFPIPDLLFKHRNQDFISTFIEGRISRWLPDIQEHVEQCMEEGATKDAAYIRILPQSFFAENIQLYFKLIKEEHPDEYISILSSAVVEAKKMSEEQEKLKEEAESKKTAIEQLQLKLDSTTIALKKSKAKQSEYIAEIQSLKQKISNMDEQNVILQNKEKVIVALEAEIAQLKKSEKDLRLELNSTQSNYKQLEAQVREEVKKQQAQKLKKQATALKPLRPIDMDEFKEYLGYNLKDIGAATPSDCLLLLKQHLCDILFRGIPIVMNRGAGVPLMKCVANALIGNAHVATLTYHKDISTQEIEAFLSEDTRVVCLDGFLGNYSETELLALLERHRNKIVFLTLAFDRTLRFVPYEIFRYCHYLNLNRVQTLSVSDDLTEDPSVFEETEVGIPEASPDTRYSPLLKEMLSEFGLSTSLAIHKCAHISNEQDLCCALAFDILPYCADVLQIAPFAVSERLIKYASDRGRCSYKNLFKEWFA